MHNFQKVKVVISNWIRDHPFKMLAFFRGGGVKNITNLQPDTSKNLPTGRDGVKNRKNLPAF